MDAASLLNPELLLWMFLGSLLGIVWAALPGLSTTMAIALLTGLTYGFDFEIALGFLLSTYVGAVFGGALSAIMINIPGTPDNVPTQMAAWPLALRGEGARALGTALMFSFIGNWIGVLSLIVLTPFVVDLAVKFTSWEVTLIAIMGVLVSGSLTANERPIKGWMAGILGLLISLVGRDSLTGIERFTFGFDALGDGIDFLPVLIGVFGLAEIVRVLSAENIDELRPALGSLLPPLNFYRKYWRSALRSGLIGTTIGIIPGTGANVATYVSYRIGEQITKRRFSKGDYEGIVCSEVADNANIGGGLLPMLTLGIPGNNSTAILMSAMLLHGVQVGPAIEQSSPGLLSYIYVSLVVANFMMIAGMLLLQRPIIKVFGAPRGLLMPLIGVFALLGAYLVNSSMQDVLVMFIAGLLGFFFVRYGYPLAPLILGIILGPILDENLRRTLQVHSDNFGALFQRPVALVLLAVIGWITVRSIKISVKNREPVAE